MNRKAIAIVLVLLIGISANIVYAQQLWDSSYLLETNNVSEHQDAKPPLSNLRIAGESMTGCFLSSAVFLTSILITIIVLDSTNSDDTLWRLGISLSVAASSFASAVGVYAIGNIGDQTGSFRATLIGSSIPAALAILSYYSSLQNNEEAGMAIMGGLLYSVVGAIVGFNMTRRHDLPPAESKTALLSLRNKQISYAFPSLYSQTDPFGRGNVSQSINLLRVKF